MQRILLGAALLSLAAAYIAPLYADSGTLYTAATKLPKLNVSLPSELSVTKYEDQDESSSLSQEKKKKPLPLPSPSSTSPCSAPSAASHKLPELSDSLLSELSEEISQDQDDSSNSSDQRKRKPRPKPKPKPKPSPTTTSPCPTSPADEDESSTSATSPPSTSPPSTSPPSTSPPSTSPPSTSPADEDESSTSATSPSSTSPADEDESSTSATSPSSTSPADEDESSTSSTSPSSASTADEDESSTSSTSPSSASTADEDESSTSSICPCFTSTTAVDESSTSATSPSSTSPADEDESSTSSTTPCPTSPADEDESSTSSASPSSTTAADEDESSTSSTCPCATSPADEDESSTSATSPSSTSPADEDESSTSSTTPCPTSPADEDESSTSSPSPSSTPPADEDEASTPSTCPCSPSSAGICCPKRRVVTYDQRQEGEYNIRADLDNFMILFIPPSPNDGFNLLDLLTKSSLRKSSHSSSKNKKKYYSPSMGLKPDSSLKFRQLLKNPDYYPQQQQAASSRVGEFIEGRTPYHVDISSLNGDVDTVQSRLNPDRQVDVLPPPSYPLAYQHLIKPYLEAESSIIQTLPPADLTSHQNAESPKNAGFYRFARYIRGDNFLDSNRVATNNRLGSPQAQASTRRITQIPLYRSELSMGASKLYPPLDIPNFSLTSSGRSLEEKKSSNSGEDIDGKQTLDATGAGAGVGAGAGAGSGISGSDMAYEDVFLPSVHIRPLTEDLELELHTDDLIDEEAKALLRDGIERCAPGNRRDSYGVCREIEGY